jgi:hypothetical protein
MKVKDKLDVTEIYVSDHAAMRWSQRVDPGAKPAPEEIAFLLWLYLITGEIEWLTPQNLGIFCAAGDIISCGSLVDGELVVKTFIGRKSNNPALRRDPVKAILWHNRQTRREMEAYARAM